MKLNTFLFGIKNFNKYWRVINCMVIIRKATIKDAERIAEGYIKIPNYL
jgi:hypothetical protein